MSIERALAYHARTKHFPGRYARSLGYLDWATQPDPFRRFEGAPLVTLERPTIVDAPSFDSLYTVTAPARPIDRTSIAQLLYDSLALSAWKESGKSRWSLRCNPSSGNLHPTEAYAITDAIDPGPAIFHYQPFLHALERRRTIDRWEAPSGTLFVALTSIHWREAWKYGERAYRYCQHDVGHAIGALGFAAAALGWRTRVMWSANDDDLERWLGAQTGVEREHPDVLVCVSTGDFPDKIEFGEAELIGTPNALSDDHHEWPIIDDVASACRRVQRPSPVLHSTPDTLADRHRGARRLFRQRRSAVDMDGVTSIDAETFHRMMRRLDAGLEPARALAIAPRVHAAIFVHRVKDVAPGLYLLARRDGALEAMRAAMHPDFEWTRASPDLHLLAEGDAKGPARIVMCGQDIAADGAFAVAFLAELELDHAWQYRTVHWEAGLLGQILYLEAEAAGVRATGIGCFFDDLVHEMLGLTDRRFHMIYGFTVGGPVDDARLRMLEAYAHLE